MKQNITERIYWDDDASLYPQRGRLLDALGLMVWCRSSLFASSDPHTKHIHLHTVWEGQTRLIINQDDKSWSRVSRAGVRGSSRRHALRRQGHRWHPSPSHLAQLKHTQTGLSVFLCCPSSIRPRAWTQKNRHTHTSTHPHIQVHTELPLTKIEQSVT